MTHTDEVVEIERFVLWYIENHDDGFTTSIFGQVEAFRSRLVEFIATAQSAKVEEIVKIAEDMMQDTNPMEDGVPVETYGYEETHNNALWKLIRTISPTPTEVTSE